MEELSSDLPIGIFDSGIGGLTVADAVIRHLPNERIIYFGDTAHLPYGEKSADAIRYYCLKIARFLLEKRCKMIVVACNSAASTGYNALLEFFRQQALFVSVVDPLVEKVATLENVSKVGIIATKATIASGIYQRKLLDQQPSWKVGALATPLLGPMIEAGFIDNSVSEAVLDTYLSAPELQGIDSLLLACTHYPLIKDNIAQWYPNPITILDSTDVVAEAIKAKLNRHHLLNMEPRGEHHFFVSDFTPEFEQTTRLFFGEAVKLESAPIW